MNDELIRLKAAIAAIHNHLHAGNINAAHEACEKAICGETVSQPNLTISQSAKVAIFGTRFNSLAESLDFPAAWLALLPSASVPGMTSFQCGGEMTACKMIERMFGGKSSIYQGEHP